VTDEPQSPPSAAGEPVTEERAAISSEPATAVHQAAPNETVKLPTQISEPAAVTTPSPAGATAPPAGATAPAAGATPPPAGATPPPAGATPPAATRPPIPPPVPPAVETGPQPGSSPIDKVTALVSERPEVGVGGAFAGGIVFALILKRLGR
jgi:hypothetical protein